MTNDKAHPLLFVASAVLLSSFVGCGEAGADGQANDSDARDASFDANDSGTADSGEPACGEMDEPCCADARCSADLTCKDGRCGPNEVADDCATDADCIGRGVGFVCKQGVCACAVSCGGECIDSQNDVNHCGGCDSVCPAEATCESGACICPDGRIACAGACVDAQSDAANCGTCGVECALGASCTQGECKCPVHLPDICSNACTDLRGDIENCGACGASCTSSAFGGSCEYGRCFSSWAGWPMPSPASANQPHPASYGTSAAGVVVDNVTGLMWQRAVPDELFAWREADEYCANLSLMGYDDWRVPKRIELISLLDFTRREPAIDVAAFPETPSELFWTSSELSYLYYIVRWRVDFESGHVNYANTGQARVRCVR